MLSKRTRHPQWGLVAARNVAKARTLQKGQPAIIKLKETSIDLNQNKGACIDLHSSAILQDNIEL